LRQEEIAMAADDRVTAARANWIYRFTSAGVPVSDFIEVTNSIEHWGEWCAAWSDRAAIHEEVGHAELAAGHGLSAGQHLTTAAVCYHFAKFMFVDDLAQMHAAHEKAVACRTLALPHLTPPGRYPTSLRPANASRFRTRTARWPAICASRSGSGGHRWWS
jgi:2,6-dihydroxypseudooxynicotine hydrolase